MATNGGPQHFMASHIAVQGDPRQCTATCQHRNMWNEMRQLWPRRKASAKRQSGAEHGRLSQLTALEGDTLQRRATQGGPRHLVAAQSCPSMAA